MKNIILSVLVISFISSCSAPKALNTVVVDPSLEYEILLGNIDEVGLSNYAVFEGADKHYENYIVDTLLASKINQLSANVTITIIFGSWCGDSQYNVPAFQKIVESSGFDKSRVNYIAVDRNKKGGNVDVSGYKAEYVPTFIFYRNNKEIGRIIEYPSGKNIEEDWVNILSVK